MTGVWVNAIGVCAGLCSMVSFIPQIARILRERNAQSVSRRMYLISVAGFALWSAYGWIQHSWPLVLSNLVNLSLVAVILALKLRWPGREPEPVSGEPGEARDLT